MKKVFEDIFDIVKAIVKWFFTRDNLRNILFGIKVSKALLENKTLNVSKKQKEELLRRLEIAKEIVDTITRNMPNQGVSQMVELINNNQDVFKDITARLEPNKNGTGNDGINLDFVGSLLGIVTKII